MALELDECEKLGVLDDQARQEINETLTKMMGERLSNCQRLTKSTRENRRTLERSREMRKQFEVREDPLRARFPDNADSASYCTQTSSSESRELDPYCYDCSTREVEELALELQSDECHRSALAEDSALQDIDEMRLSKILCDTKSLIEKNRRILEWSREERQQFEVREDPLRARFPDNADSASYCTQTSSSESRELDPYCYDCSTREVEELALELQSDECHRSALAEDSALQDIDEVRLSKMLCDTKSMNERSRRTLEWSREERKQFKIRRKALEARFPRMLLLKDNSFAESSNREIRDLSPCDNCIHGYEEMAVELDKCDRSSVMEDNARQDIDRMLSKMLRDTKMMNERSRRTLEWSREERKQFKIRRKALEAR